MTAFDAASATLAIADADDPETLMVIGGVRLSRLQLATQFQASRAMSNNSWNNWLNGSGEKGMRLSFSGIATGNSGEQELVSAAFNGQVRGFTLTLADSTIISGDFIVSEYERHHDREDAGRYNVTLRSNGELEYSGG